MRRYGALRKVMPVTYVTFIARLPGHHRDAAVLRLLHQGRHHRVVFRQGRHVGRHPRHGGGASARRITGFYMTRMVLMTFMGKPRWEQEVPPNAARRRSRHPGSAPHPHESPAVMIWPMIVLAIGSVVVGGFLVINNRLANFLAPVIGQAPAIHALFNVTSVVTLAVVLLGVLAAWAMYGRVEVPAVAPPGRLLTRPRARTSTATRSTSRVLMRPGQWLTRLSVYFDSRGIDGAGQRLRCGGGRVVRAAAPDPDRLRPLVRPVDVLRRRAAGRRPARGEAVDDMNSVPWLTITGAIPLAGRDRDRRDPRPAGQRRRSRPRGPRPAVQAAGARLLRAHAGLVHRDGDSSSSRAAPTSSSPRPSRGSRSSACTTRSAWTASRWS